MGTAGTGQSNAYHDQVIEAAFLHSKPGCYFIGPYARRVSFASQQFRTLDLVEALASKDKIPERGRVAVIGGGLAGLMAVAALRGRKCKVDLYEAEDEILTRQRHAAHRLVHPTISRWPMEPLSLTTSFPFFDWAVAPCDRIIEILRAEWSCYFDPATTGDDDLKIIPNARIKNLIPGESDSGKVVGLTSPVDEQEEYGLVIVTTGYGAERAQGNMPVTSYWTPDELEEKRQGPGSFAVGGVGDGGLIDALRLAHNAFNSGWLAFAVAEKLDSTEEGREVARIIGAAEHDALMMLKSIACMSRKPGETSHDDTRMLRLLDEAYTAAVVKLPPDVEKLLDDSLRDGVDMRGRIILAAPEDYPTVPNSAPIHKLMIVHAIRKGYVTWHKGRLVPKRNMFVLKSEGDNKLADYQVIQRHGASSALEGLLLDGEVATLRLRQFMLADRIEVSFDRSAVPPRRYPARSAQCMSFIGSRHAAARALVAGVDPRFEVDAGVEGFKYVRISDEADPPFGCGASVGVSLPGKLFGVIPAEYAEPALYEMLA